MTEDRLRERLASAMDRALHPLGWPDVERRAHLATGDPARTRRRRSRRWAAWGGAFAVTAGLGAVAILFTFGPRGEQPGGPLETVRTVEYTVVQHQFRFPNAPAPGAGRPVTYTSTVATDFLGGVSRAVPLAEPGGSRLDTTRITTRSDAYRRVPRGFRQRTGGKAWIGYRCGADCEFSNGDVEMFTSPLAYAERMGQGTPTKIGNAEVAGQATTRYRSTATVDGVPQEHDYWLDENGRLVQYVHTSQSIINGQPVTDEIRDVRYTASVVRAPAPDDAFSVADAEAADRLVASAHGGVDLTRKAVRVAVGDATSPPARLGTIIRQDLASLDYTLVDNLLIAPAEGTPTSVIYAPGKEQEGRMVASDLQIRTVRPDEGSGTKAPADVVVIVADDFMDKLIP